MRTKSDTSVLGGIGFGLRICIAGKHKPFRNYILLDIARLYQRRGFSARAVGWRFSRCQRQ